MENPFNYLQFATGDRFYDREDIRKDLRSRFLSGQTNVVLYGPRRYGKSSLVAELTADLEAAGIPCITLDVVKVPSIDLFVSAYAQKVYRRLAPVKFELRRLGDFFKSLRPKLTFGADGEAGISFEAVGSEIGSEALTEVLDLPQRLLGKGKRAVVVFDEFQEVGDLLPDDRFERVMRSVIQRHTQVSYIFLGSRYHMLRRMFTDHNRPFYKSASLMHLGKPESEDSSRYVTSRMKAYGLHIEKPLADQLVAIAESVPYYVQALAFHVFEATVRRKANRVSADDLSNGVDVLLEMNRDLYETYLTNLSQAQRKLLSALARESAGRFDTAYRTRHSLGVSSTVHSSLVRLQENGLVEQSEGVYLIGDPIFKRYLLG